MNTGYQTPFRKKSNAAEFRRQAREALKGRWFLAICALIIASLLGATTGSGSTGFGYSNQSSGTQVEMPDLNQADPFASIAADMTEVMALMETGDYGAVVEYIIQNMIGATLFLIVAAITLFLLFYSIFVGSPATVGYHRFNLDLIDRKPGLSLNALFYGFRKCYLKSIGVNVILSLIQIGIWVAMAIAAAIVCVVCIVSMSELALLGVLAVVFCGVALSVWMAYRYAICYYILAEYPELGVMDVLRNSASLMKGNKFRLFCLQLSFIGWTLLAACCTCGLGNIVVTPYTNAAFAAFYYEVTGHEVAKDVEFPSVNPDDYFPEL